MASTTTATTPIIRIRVDSIDPDPQQPRFEWDLPDAKAELEELGASLVVQGQLDPVTVSPHPDKPGRFLLENGERRLRAAKLKGIEALDAIVLSPEQRASREARLLAQLAHNSGRRLTKREQAHAFQKLRVFGMTQDEIAAAAGVGKSTVGDLLAMAEAPEAVKPLFEEGVLTAAAAPIVRQLAELPAAKVKEIIEYAEQDMDWEDAVDDGKSVPVKAVKRAIEEAIDECLVALEPGSDVYARYRGPKATIKGKLYALDDAKARTIVQQVREDKARQGAKESAPAKRELSADELRYREQRRKENEKARQRNALRRLQFEAVSAKLPSALDQRWQLFVIRYLCEEMHQDALRNITSALGIPSEKTSRGSYREYTPAIATHAEQLNLDGRTRLIVQLLLAPDLYASPYGSGGPKRLSEAAKLAGVQLPTKLPKAEESRPAGSGEKAQRSRNVTEAEARAYWNAGPSATCPSCGYPGKRHPLAHAQDCRAFDFAAPAPTASVRKPAAEVLSPFLRSRLGKKLLKKPIDAWPNDEVLRTLEFARAQLAKFDDRKAYPDAHLPLGVGSANRLSREQTFLGGAERNDAVLDIRELTGAAEVRGLLKPPKAKDIDRSAVQAAIEHEEKIVVESELDDDAEGDLFIDETAEDLWDAEESEEATHAEA